MTTEVHPLVSEMWDWLLNDEQTRANPYLVIERMMEELGCDRYKVFTLLHREAGMYLATKRNKVLEYPYLHPTKCSKSMSKDSATASERIVRVMYDSGKASEDWFDRYAQWIRLGRQSSFRVYAEEVKYVLSIIQSIKDIP